METKAPYSAISVQSIFFKQWKIELEIQAFMGDMAEAQKQSPPLQRHLILIMHSTSPTQCVTPNAGPQSVINKTEVDVMFGSSGAPYVCRNV